MTTIDSIYQEMQHIAPLALAESWDNPGLLVDCGGGASRVLVTLDITPEVVEEAARKGCQLIVSHHPVIFSPLKKLGGQDVAFQLVKNGISAICMHTNLDAAEGGVNEVLAGFFGMREMEAFAEGCGRVGSIDPITVPELAKKVQQALADSLEMLNKSAPSDQVIKLKSIEAMQKVADGKATKIIIPSEMQGLVGLANGIVEGTKE